MPANLTKLFPKLRQLAGPIRFIARTFEGKSTAEFLSEATIRRRKKIARYSYHTVFAALVAALFAIPNTNNNLEGKFDPGDMVEATLVSPLTAEIEIHDGGGLRKRAVTRRTPPVYDYDDAAWDKWLRSWQQAFRTVRERHYSSAKRPSKNGDALNQQIRETIYDITEQSLLPEHLDFLHRNRFNSNTEKAFVRLAERLQDKMISATDLFATHSSTGILIRHLGQHHKEFLVQDLTRIWTTEQAAEALSQNLRSIRDGKTEVNSKTLSQLVASIVPANVQFNAAQTQKRLEQILATEKPSRTLVRAGQVIARRGERLTEVQADTIERLQNLLQPENRLRRAAYAFAILLVFISILFRTNYLGRGFWYLSLKDCLFFLIVTVCTLAAAKFTLPLFKHLLAGVNVLEGAQYLLPLSAGGIIIHLMMGKEAGHAFALFAGITSAFLLEQDLFYALWTYVISASAIQSIKSCKQRTDLYKCGIFSGALGAILVLGFSLWQSTGVKNLDGTLIFTSGALAFCSGFLSSVITSVLIPLVESVGGYTTSLKLLELSNFNHPLLHSLMMKAPGTYHHSVIVGSLAELAADRVNANGLLARVSAYYHDIGKMGKPLYFIENQTPGQNPHDHLAPNMSAKILFSHVKNGVRLGREYNLGKRITDIIEQHHGTTIVSYFFNKAKNSENPDVETTQEAAYRYPGPRPQSREAAIVMLADACEAATRSIAEPTAAKIQGMVRSVINRRFLEEQFNECELTFHDLQVIEENFVRTLVSLYHHRIEYPGQKKDLTASTPVTSAQNARRGA